MRSSKVRYRLSPNEEAEILQQEHDRRRKLRIQQVREQERAFAKQIRGQVEVKKQQELNALAIQLRNDWQIAKEEEQQALKDLYQKNLNAFGGAHSSAEKQPPYDKIREEMKVENDKKAKERGQRAIQKQQEDDEKRLQEEFALVMARKTALEIERARAALIAKKPSRKSDLNDAETTKEPTRVLHLDGFSTTHYTVPTEYAEKADPEEQGDAKQAAREEEKRMKEEMKEKKQELEERKTKASLRQRHAQEKEQLEKDLNHLLEELGQMEQADRRRRQLVVSNIPKQIFVPPHRRLEEKEEVQKDLEQAFENMYMAKTDYAGDIELALEPALPQVEADLDLSSDVSEEQFKVPDRTEPKRFPQGLDGVQKKSPTGKRDTLRKLLLKVQSQKHDHKLRKKTEISEQVVDGLPQESSSPSEVTESVSSDGVTSSSITTASTTAKTSSSSQTSSHLSQHPLSSSESESRITSSGSASLETGPISDESSSNGKSTLMHPLEAACKLRKKEKEEETLRLRNHKTTTEEKTFEEFYPLQEQTSLGKDHRVNYLEEQKVGSVSGETQSLEETPEFHVQDKQETEEQSRTEGFKVPARNGDENYEKDDISSRGTAGFQPLEPSQMMRLTPEPEQNLAMGISELKRVHHGHMVDIPSEKEGFTLNRQSGEQMLRPIEDIHGREFNREVYQQIDVRGKGHMAKSQSQQQLSTKSWVKGHMENPLSTKRAVAQGKMSRISGESHSGQLIRDLSPRQLESVRRAYPNIYEAVTGSKSVDAKVDIVPSVEDTSNHTTQVSRTTGGDYVVESKKVDSNRKFSPKKTALFDQRDNAGSKVTRSETDALEGNVANSVLGVATSDLNRGSVSEGGISEESSDMTTDPSEVFKSSLHDYQEQLLKLQRTNQLELLEAQAQLQQRRQRLMNLYPQIQLPAYKPYIPAGSKEVPGRGEAKGGNDKEDGQENERRSGRMDPSVTYTPGGNMRQEGACVEQEVPMVLSYHTAERGRELRTTISGDQVEKTFHNGGNLKEMNARLKRSSLDTAQNGVPDSALVKSSGLICRSGETHPFQDLVRGSKMSDQGQLYLQSFGTPPLHSEGLPSTSNYDSGYYQFQPPQQVASRFHEAQNERKGPQLFHQELWGTPHVHGKEAGLASGSETVSQAQGQVEKPDVRKMQTKDDSDNNRCNSSSTVESKSIGSSPHGVWRPVKELKVSLPSVDLMEQSPLTVENTLSSFSEQGLSFTRTPTTESHGPSIGPLALDLCSKQGDGQQVLLTPRKLAQSDGGSSFNLSLDLPSQYSVPKVDQTSQLQEAVSPRKLITPRMLVGERLEVGKMHDTYLNPSFEGEGTVLLDGTNVGVIRKSPDAEEKLHYRFKNKTTSSRQETLSGDFGSRVESQRYFQKFESFKRDLGAKESHQTSKSSPELISPGNVTGGTVLSQTMSNLSWQSQSESSLDLGKFSKFERLGSTHSHGRLFSEDDSVVLNIEKDIKPQGSPGLGQTPVRADQIPVTTDNSPTKSTKIGQVSAHKFSDDDKDVKSLSETTVSHPQGILDPSHVIRDETTKDDPFSEEPTDRGLLEALKNLMLAKARRKVPRGTTKTTNYFTHLDLTSSASEEINLPELYKDGNESLKSSDVPSKLVFGRESEIGDTMQKGPVEHMEEVKAPMGRHRIHHKPPVANQSKLLALEEMAPHELSTIIEVETPVFENLPRFPFAEEEDGKETERFQAGALQLFDEGVTSSSDWGTPHHHTPGSSQGSGSNQMQEIYIHQPMMVSSLHEEVTPHQNERLGSNNAMDKEYERVNVSIMSKKLRAESLTISSVFSASSQTADNVPSKDSNLSFAPLEMSSQLDNLDDVTISEGPINTSSENSFHQQVTEQGSGVPLEQGVTSNQLFPLSSDALKMRSSRHDGRDQKLTTVEGRAMVQYLRGMTRSPASFGTMGTSVDRSDYRESKVEERLSTQSFRGQAEDGDLTLEEGSLQQTLPEEFSALRQDDQVEVPHLESKMRFQIPSHEYEDPSEEDVDLSRQLHAPDKASVTDQVEERSLGITEGSHQGFFADLMGHYNTGQAEKEGEDWSHAPSSHSEGTNLEQATTEAGIMEEPELTFQTTFDTNVTLESVQDMHQGEMVSNPSDSLLSFIRHEEQFAHSTPLKHPTQPSTHVEQADPSQKEGPKESSEPLTLQEALARHKSSFIKASQARQKEVKVHTSMKSQSGTAFALTIKNWQKARLEAQQKGRPKGMIKQTVSNKENVEVRSKVAPRTKTTQDRKAALKADKERTKRLYNQLEEVRQRKMQSERQKSYAENRQKRKEYEEKLKQRRLQLKNQAQKK